MTELDSEHATHKTAMVQRWALSFLMSKPSSAAPSKSGVWFTRFLKFQSTQKWRMFGSLNGLTLAVGNLCLGNSPSGSLGDRPGIFQNLGFLRQLAALEPKTPKVAAGAMVQLELGPVKDATSECKVKQCGLVLFACLVPCSLVLCFLGSLVPWVLVFLFFGFLFPWFCDQ